MKICRMKSIAACSVFCFSMLLFAGCETTRADVRAAASRGDIDTLVKYIVNREESPEVYDESIVSLARIGKSAVPALIKELQYWSYSDILGRLSKTLAAIGPDAREAVPALVKKNIDNITHEDFVIDISPKGSNAAYGGIVDYRILERDVDTNINVKTLSPDAVRQIESKKAELRGIYGDSIDFTSIDLYHAKYYLEKYRITETVQNLIVRYSIYYSSYAIAKITGEDPKKYFAK